MDQLGAVGSGLDVLNALNALQPSVHSMFNTTWQSIMDDTDAQITFKTATEVAGALTAGVFAPIYAQIEPMHVGEVSRVITIARQYGIRLSKNGKNLKSQALEKLIARYPSHGFVIDRAEAEELFENVREPNDLECELLDAIGYQAKVIYMPESEKEPPGLLGYLSDEIKPTSGENNVHGARGNNRAAAARASGEPRRAVATAQGQHANGSTRGSGTKGGRKRRTS
jgi:hypothetical protein